MGASPWLHALPLLQLLQQPQYIVGELVPLPPHPRQLHRLQAGVGGPVPVGAADLAQQQPGAVRVHVHQVEENTLEKSRKKGKVCKEHVLGLAPSRVITRPTGTLVGIGRDLNRSSSPILLTIT